MTRAFDAIIIGAGQAGPSLAVRLGRAGMRVALIERQLFGGTCVNTGCTPTKALVASAYAAHLAHRSAEFGVNLGEPVNVDWTRVRERQEEIVRRSRESVESWVRGADNCTVYRGHARLQSTQQVRIAEDLLTAARIFLNVGARARVPPLPGIEQINYLTNSRILKLDSLPRHLVVIGGSYVGLEFAQIFRRFGCQVTVVEMNSRLIHREDLEISDAVRAIMEAEGIEVRMEAECIRFERMSAQTCVHVACRTGEPAVLGSHVLLAVGRQPNTDDLGLDQAGVEVDDHGYIKVDDELRTSAHGIWALGECNGRGAFTHTSYNDYEIVASNLLDGERRSVRDRILAYALFTDPPLGRAGLTEAEARARGHQVLVGSRPMTRVARAIEKGETQGLMKVIVDRGTRQILGAAILGTGGDEAIHCVLDTMYARAPYTMLQRAVHIHPTVSELIPTVLGELKSSSA